MKKILVLLMVFALSTGMIAPVFAKASSEVFDANDLKAIKRIAQTIGVMVNGDEDNPLTWQNAYKDEHMDLVWSKSSPRRLEELGLSGKSLVGTLDVRQLTALKRLSVDTTGITSIDIGSLNALESLTVMYSSGISTLQVVGMNKLQYLRCDVPNLKLGGLSSLKTFSYVSTKSVQFNSFNLPSSLEELTIYGMGVSEIELSRYPKLRAFHIFNTNVSKIDLSNNPMINNFMCDDNPRLRELNLSGVSEDFSESFYGCPVVKIITRNKKTAQIVQDIGTAYFTRYSASSDSVDFEAWCDSGMEFIDWVIESDNQIKTEYRGHSKIGTGLRVTPRFSGIAVAYSAADVNAMIQIADSIKLDLGKTPNNPATWPFATRSKPIITWNNANPRRLVGININSNFGFQTLTGNLDLRALSELEVLYCSYTPIIGLNASGLRKLRTVDCSSCKNLKKINVSNCIKLESLLCYGTATAELNLKGLPPKFRFNSSGNLNNPSPVTNLTTPDGKNGIIRVSGNGRAFFLSAANHMYDSSESIRIIALPRTGYRFVNWTESGKVHDSSSQSFLTINANRIIQANFEPIPGSKPSPAASPLPNPTVTPVCSVSLSKAQLDLDIGKTEVLNAFVLPSTISQRVTWASDNKKIATVSSSGKVKGIKAGVTTITAIAKSGNVARCTVTVYKKATKVTLSKKKLTLDINQAVSLKATVKPTGANKKVKWTSSNVGIVTITAEGEVKGIKPGKAKITAKATNGKKATCTITVREIKASKVSLSTTNTTTRIGDSITIAATIKPDNVYNTKIKWSSSNKKVATVDNSGKVKALKKGSVTITAKTSNGKKASCKITVQENVNKAILVGLSDYSSTGYENLPGAQDIKGIKGLISNSTNRKYNIIASLSSADKSRISSIIKSAAKDSREGDTLLFYFAGHGADDGSLMMNDYSRVNGGTRYPLTQLRDDLRAFKGNKIVILESCYSGWFIRQGGLDSSFIVISATDFEQTGKAKKDYAVFTKLLCEAGGWDMQKSKKISMKGDKNKDKKLTLKEAKAHIDFWLPTQVFHKQDVQIYGADGYVLFGR